MFRTIVGPDYVQVGKLRIALQRTLRVPDDGRQYPLPPGFGRFAVRRGKDFIGKVPRDWPADAAFVALHQNEAMWLAFEAPHDVDFAVQVAVGNVNVLTGERADTPLRREPRQNYLVCPYQPWLDGILVAKGRVRQFVAVELGRGHTIESQLTQYESGPAFRFRMFARRPGVKKPPATDPAGRVARGLAMGAGAGGLVQQKVYPDPYPPGAWSDQPSGTAALYLCNALQFAAITGTLPPASPISADDYQRHGLPWFELYDADRESLASAKRLARVRSVDRLHGKVSGRRNSFRATTIRLARHVGGSSQDAAARPRILVENLEVPDMTQSKSKSTLARLARLRREVQAWERQQFGAPSAPARGKGVAAALIGPQMPVAPWNEALEIEAAVSPDCSYRLVERAISAAKKSVLLYIYNISDDRLADLLRARLKAKVKVRVMHDTTDGNSAKSENPLLDSLPGAVVREAPSSGNRRIFTVCHQKYAVIDGASVLLGSANWAGTAIPFLPQPGSFKKGNREWLVHLKSRTIAGWFSELFEKDWAVPAKRAALAALPPVGLPAGVVVPARLVRPSTVLDIGVLKKDGPLEITPLLSPQNYFDAVRDLIRGAKKSIDIQQQYILAGGKNIEALLEELRRRSRDVAVRIMVSPAFEKNWDRSLETLDIFRLKSKLKALNLDSFIHLHNKGLLVDRRATVISSTNWSENSIARARETGVLVHSTALAKYFGKAFDADWKSGWKPSEVPRNVMRLMQQTPFREPGAFLELSPGELT